MLHTWMAGAGRQAAQSTQPSPALTCSPRMPRGWGPQGGAQTGRRTCSVCLKHSNTGHVPSTTTCMHTHKHTHTHTSTYMLACSCGHALTCTLIHICRCSHTCPHTIMHTVLTRVHSHTFKHIHAQIHIYSHMLTHTCAHTCSCGRARWLLAR